MGDADTATSVRGKGWVTFDDSTDGAVSSSSPRRLSQSEDTPGSLEVSSKLMSQHCTRVLSVLPRA